MSSGSVYKRQTIAGFLFFLMFSELSWPVMASQNLSANYYALSSVIDQKKLLDNREIYTSSNNRDIQNLRSRPEAPLKNKIGLENKPTHGIDGKITKETLPAEQVITEEGPGPTQPEMQSFQPVNNNNMVDLFTGDFSYNIPLLDVGGYPVNIHYQSGITMDQEASWVGLGWNINPGTINRSVRGLPDDFSGQDSIKKTTSVKPNKTLGVTVGTNTEILGVSLPKKGSSDTGALSVSIGSSLGVFHNTYKGWGTEIGMNAGINAGSPALGSLSTGLSLANNSQDGLDISPSFGVTLSKLEKYGIGQTTIGTNYNSRTGIQGLQMTTQVGLSKMFQDNAQKVKGYIGSGISSFISFAGQSYTPSISIPFTSSQFAFTAKIGSEKWVVHPNMYVKGYSSIQYIAPEDTLQTLPAYGYLYYQNAGSDQHVLLDFNRDKDVPYRENVPHIAIPGYTYDTYSISGEGTGGMFRPYRGDIGFVFDHSSATKNSSNKFSIDLGFGKRFHVGIDFNGTYTSTRSGSWWDENNLKDQIRFKSRDTTFEEVYFKNPGEKTSVDQAFYDGIGDVDLVKGQFSKIGPSSTILSPYLDRYKNARIIGKTTLNSSNAFRQKRDKRNQVISFLTASQARSKGLDTCIKSYPVNIFPNSACNVGVNILPRIDALRKEKHVSEITVLNDDGRRYIYGIPVYNITQQDVTFASKTSSNNNTGLIAYSPGENSTQNSNGQDNYFSRDVLPPYAHSYLLTGILSPDYSDVKGDGITEDDIGDAIKFNYSKIYGSSNGYRWRAPYSETYASYNEGLKTDKRDDKASYSYGTKEVWYLNSLESKAMMATFVLETRVDSLRKDAFGTKGENGGQDASQNLFRLKEINLYSKADVIKNGIANAKPIKTVHFDYDYSLCPNNPSSASGAGKLTLRRIWFSYNKNEKNKLNPYEFNYHNNNPSYNNKSYDRWGNYKDPAENPSGLTNMDYPYTSQLKGSNVVTDSTNAANAVAAWTLTDIKLPSGAKIKVSYESDEYAFVQNKRATQMFTINGFGKTNTAVSLPNLYTKLSNNSWEDYYYVFVNITDAISATNSAAIKQEILTKYLDGIKKLYFKLFVQMPGDAWGTGSEFVPCYADIEDYGLKGNNSDKTIWIKVAPINGKSPMTVAAMQFLRLNLPSKAYPESEPGEGATLRQVIGSLKSVASNIAQTKKGFIDYSRSKNWCNFIGAPKSFVKLNNPFYRKFGGGLRVKKVEISDNWNAMTGQTESKYGQEYNYTIIKEINGIKTKISSGVASYEPSIGKDENPFTAPIDYYQENIGALAPTNYFYTEEPLAESFYPSASVGYSRVTVQTIHKDKKSANGLEETEFYTTYDFPTKTEITTLADGKVTYNPKLKNFFKFNAKHYVTLSQGFKVELNDMNGKVKRQASYAQNDLENPFSYTINYYKVQNDTVKNLSGNVPVIDSANGIIKQNGEIGKDIDILVDLREQTTQTFAPSLQANVDIASFVPPIILGSLIPSGSLETNRYRSAAIMKVVNRYGILDSVIHIEKGSKVSTKNMVYDGETGNVLLTRTNNEFDDPVYNFNYPAHWAKSSIGHAYKNVGAVFKDMNFKAGRLFKLDQPFNVNDFFESGDELLVTSRSQIINTIYPVGSCEPYFILKPSWLAPKSTTLSVWAIDVSKGNANNQGIYFIDKHGMPVTLAKCTITIVRSGKRNFTAASVGSVTMLDNPIRTVNSIQRIVIDSLSKVITASAGEFREFWKVDSSLYSKDSCYTIVKSDSVTLTSNKSMLFRKTFRNYGSGKIDGYQNDNKYLNQNLSVGIVRKHDQGRAGKSFDLVNSSTIDFDFSDLAGVSVTSAKLSLGAKPYNDTLKEVKVKPLIGSEHTYFGAFRDQYAHYNNGNNTAYGNGFALERVLTPWGANSNSVMDNIAVSHINSVLVGSAPDASCNDITNLECGALIQDIINSKNKNGIMLSVPTIVLSGNSNSARRSRSFYSGFDYNYSVEDLCKQYIGKGYLEPGKPTLKIYFTTSKDTCVQLCRPNIDSSSVNPYRWGILGNWRMNKTYNYYGNRKETDPNPNIKTDTRTDEQIKAFLPYWAFGSPFITPINDTSRWVWNSEIIKYNRKGMEIENVDPLGRYNSGQYGYNQSIPVALTQNSKLRNTVFDGFEDYDYKTNSCNMLCPTARYIDFVAGGGVKDSLDRHTGKYSLKLTGNQTTSTVIPVVTTAQDSIPSTLLIKPDSVYNPVNKVVTGKGNGLLIKYGNYFSCSGIPVPLRSTSWSSTTEVGNVDKDWGKGKPSQICSPDHFNAQWDGYIQPRYNDYYTFTTKSDDGIRIFINDVELSGLNAWIEAPATVERSSNPIYLEQGKLYKIQVLYFEKQGAASVQLSWSSNNQVKQVVPTSQLYLPTYVPADTAGSVITVPQYCVKFNSPKPSNVTLKTFSPIAGTKMVITAWVKEQQPCTNGNYTSSSIDISFQGSALTFQFKPKGTVIEGWQRIEDTLSIPLTATTMSVLLRSLSSASANFDDIRFHPFNALMKSYVYDPVSLRLMAELDENNFASFYEYDDDGTLSRVKKETERGIKTIQETRSALLKDQ